MVPVSVGDVLGTFPNGGVTGAVVGLLFVAVAAGCWRMNKLMGFTLGTCAGVQCLASALITIVRIEPNTTPISPIEGWIVAFAISVVGAATLAVRKAGNIAEALTRQHVRYLGYIRTVIITAATATLSDYMIVLFGQLADLWAFVNAGSQLVLVVVAASAIYKVIVSPWQNEISGAQPKRTIKRFARAETRPDPTSNES